MAVLGPLKWRVAESCTWPNLFFADGKDETGDTWIREITVLADGVQITHKRLGPRTREDYHPASFQFNEMQPVFETLAQKWPDALLRTAGSRGTSFDRRGFPSRRWYGEKPLLDEVDPQMTGTYGRERRVHIDDSEIVFDQYLSGPKGGRVSHQPMLLEYEKFTRIINSLVERGLISQP